MHAWIRPSCIFDRLTRFSCSRKASKRASTLSTIGFHLRAEGEESADACLEGEVGRKRSCAGRDARLVIVDKVAKARRVNDRQPEPDAILLNVGRRALDADGRGELGSRRGVRPRRAEGGREEGVDQGRLAEAGLACGEKEKGKGVSGRKGESGGAKRKVSAGSKTLGTARSPAAC